MTNTRANVYADGPWAEPVLWYARGVAQMQKRALKDPTSWHFWAAMHGFDPELWHTLGYLKSGEKKPAASVVSQFWSQCQHGSWYFLPWHRGYLLAFEAVVRAAVVEQGGPADWTLPYWNYFATHESDLPAEFASTTWPDHGANPLHVAGRYGPSGNGQVFVPVTEVNLQALNEPHFTGVSTGGSPGFGGVDTGFSHGGPVHGGLESQPHDLVHVYVGGSDPSSGQPGVMSDPDTAALDPIFWLHHANIDRLWEIWNRRHHPGHTGYTDPTAASWSKGPAATGERTFAMPNPDGSTWTYTPHDVKSVLTLGYQYDNLTATGTQAVVASAEQEPVPVPRQTQPELVGATTGPVTLTGQGAIGNLLLETAPRRHITAALTAPTDVSPGHDRVFLNLENVRGPSDAVTFHVYVGLGADEDPSTHPQLLAGSIAPFGVRKASKADGEHGGAGLTFVLDITDVVAHLHLSDSFDVDQLPVRLVAAQPVGQNAALEIGRISIYRQAA